MPRSNLSQSLISKSGHTQESTPDLLGSKLNKDPYANNLTHKPSPSDLIQTQENRPSPDFIAPKAVVTDGEYLYISEFVEQPISYSTTIVRKVSPYRGDGTIISVTAQMNLAADLQTVSCVHDLAIDNTYLYASCWYPGNVAIIDKAKMLVAGWGWMGSNQQATNLCIDGAGNFYCQGTDDSHCINKFATADCLGQSPNTIAPVLTYAGSVGRHIHFGGRCLWHVSQDAICKIDPATMTLVASSPIRASRVFCAFNSIWATAHDGVDLFRLDLSTLEVQAVITLISADHPTGMSIGPDNMGNAGARLYVASYGNPYVSIIDPNTNNVEATSIVSPAAGIDGLVPLKGLVYAMGYRMYYHAKGEICYINYPMSKAGPASYPKSLISAPQATYNP